MDVFLVIMLTFLKFAATLALVKLLVHLVKISPLGKVKIW